MSQEATILFIEDSKEYRDYINYFIKVKKIPIRPIFAEDGKIAIEYLFSCTKDNYPSLICVDMYLPNMTGFDFGKTYQTCFAKQFPETLLFLTTHLSFETFVEIVTDKSTLAPFCDEVLFKPLSVQQWTMAMMPKIKEKIRA